MKNIKRIIKAVIWITIVSGGLIVYLRIGATYNTMEVGFYGLSDNVVSVLSNWLNNRNIDWKPVVFDSSKPLEDQLSVPVKQNLLFTTDSKNMDTIAPYARTAKTNNLLLMSIPVRTAVRTDSRLTATPLLLDHFQFSYNVNTLRTMGSAIPTNFIDLEAIAQETLSNAQGMSSAAPILCAGGDDDMLMQFFSSMIETLHGIENYEIAQAFLDFEIEEADGNALLQDAAFESFFELEQVKDTLQYIVSWKDRGYLSSAWLSLSLNDVIRSMENSSAVFAFLPFSVYEGLSQGTRNAYAPWFMPSGNTRETRHLIAPSVVVMEFAYVKSPFQSARQSGKKNNLAASIITELVSGLTQSQLSYEAMLIPVNASSQVDEVGVGESMQIISLADGIFTDIATATFVKGSDKALFAQALRDKLFEIETE